ncbi:type II toxin-antitoxin system RelB/DinJ family antitoxin [Bilophila sp.]|uniref:type II toxin-antitoxin system RelB/DinJ family antitoxin n=1 Tax=Bilophila sp. TaxID=1929485 RepID=UPI003078586B
MANTTMVHIRVDEKLKREACAALDGMGLSLSDAVRLLLVRVAAEKALPFEIRVPNTNTIRAMEDVKVGSLESFESVTSLMDSIDENN